MPERKPTDTQPTMPRVRVVSREDAERIRARLHAEDRLHDGHHKTRDDRHTYCRDCGVRLGPSSIV
jgi:hypothetical protein